MDSSPPKHGISVASGEGDPATYVQRTALGLFEAPHEVQMRTAPPVPNGDMPMETTPSHTLGLGEESSIWFNLTPLLRGDPENPMRILMQMMERYGPVLPVNMAKQRVVLISEPEYFKHVLVTKADNYIKYFDGLKPIFGKSMITNDGAL
jgi:hypothetical protein